ncbi:unnamed protein product [Protopolystoma xenopodis]|uniref:DNA mitochondrial polymerase exonuclease domain-containing protein n=1 Tax=Protopolystoma xenopodis TaxID=117903 RepID=A0A448X562_9PLAT|nr:unnamed protein product [Protopolystoma xenopodis]
MICRDLQSTLFGVDIDSYNEPSLNILNKLKLHGVDLSEERPRQKTISFKVPALLGSDVKEHFKNISARLTGPYKKLADEIVVSVPEKPAKWVFAPGWTRYSESIEHVNFPLEDVFVFDVELLVNEGDAPVIAVAVSPSAW